MKHYQDISDFICQRGPKPVGEVNQIEGPEGKSFLIGLEVFTKRPRNFGAKKVPTIRKSSGSRSETFHTPPVE